MWPFVSGINAKSWKILIAPNKYCFIGSDNPGFLLNLDPKTREKELFRQLISVDANSLIYYVLSSKYCIEISYFEKGTPLDRCAMNMDIKFEKASVWLLDLINKGTFYTSVSILFSSDIDQLQFVEDFAKMSTVE